jgi:hypothetical protein
MVAWREIDTVRVVGRASPVRLYEPLGLADEIGEDCASLSGTYAEGLRHWRAKDFAAASRCFERLSGSDPPARTFVVRCRQLIAAPPTPGWEPIHALESK